MSSVTGNVKRRTNVTMTIDRLL